MNKLLEYLSQKWCILMHSPSSLTRPFEGKYTCLVCGLEWKCPWS